MKPERNQTFLKEKRPTQGTEEQGGKKKRKSHDLT